MSRLKYRRKASDIYGVRSVLKWDSDWCEYVVTTRSTDGSLPVSTYHTADVDDALDTQKHIFQTFKNAVALKRGWPINEQ
jgi:hypothetical protein